MFAAQQAERSRGVKVCAVTDILAGVFARQDFCLAGVHVRIKQCSQRGVVAIDLMVVLTFGHPAIGEVMLQRGEDSPGVLLPTAPFRAIVKRTWVIDPVTRRVE